MRNFATAAVAVAVIWAGLWALWQPDFAFSQGQTGAEGAAPEQTMAASCGGMMESMMGGKMGGGGESHHGMGSADPVVSVSQSPVALDPDHEARLRALDRRIDNVWAQLDAATDAVQR